MVIVCILCELVITSCTLVFLFNLHQALDSGRDGFVQHKRRQMALGFLSLAFTLAALTLMAVGIDKLRRGARTVWTRVSTEFIGGRRSSRGAVVPAVIEEADSAEEALANEQEAGGDQTASVCVEEVPLRPHSTC